MRRLNSRQIAISIIVAVAAAAVSWAWDDLTPAWRGLVVGILALTGLLVLLSRPRPVTAVSVPDPLADILERVVADETRRPWNPTTLPWLPTEAGPKPVLLVPAADYHLAEIVPLAAELERREIPTKIAIGPSPWSRAWQGLHWYPDLEIHQLPEPEQVAEDVSLVVTMKDTGSMTDWVTDIRAMGIPVVGKVEGAQDFWDSDTPDARRPYRNLDLVLCQGQFDADALAERETAIVGSTRLERLWWAPPVTPREPLAVINLNFVYGVRTADRDLWLETAIAGCEEAGIPYVVSVHPAERSRLRTNRVTRISAARLLPHATVLISRFSTLPFEAMARGVPFVYHNPHGETVKTFAEPIGAFEITGDTAGLRDAVQGASEPGDKTRALSESFFTNLVDVDGHQRSEARSADAVSGMDQA
jgi:hypothetical protein